jgi:hypothetical protein
VKLGSGGAVNVESEFTTKPLCVHAHFVKSSLLLLCGGRELQPVTRMRQREHGHGPLGQRIYFNVNEADWTQLLVARANPSP